MNGNSYWFQFQNGFPRCDFNEFLYGPRPQWPTEAEVREFESGEKPWPCNAIPPTRCKCGIVASEGVVPSELGFGKYCGNAYGEFWVRKGHVDNANVKIYLAI